MTTAKTIDISAGPVAFPAQPERTALLVIDMQKEFLIRGGYLEQMGYSVEPLRQPIEPIRRLLDTVRGTDILVIWTRYGKRADLSDEPRRTSGASRRRATRVWKELPFSANPLIWAGCASGATLAGKLSTNCPHWKVSPSSRNPPRAAFATRISS